MISGNHVLSKISFSNDGHQGNQKWCFKFFRNDQNSGRKFDLFLVNQGPVGKVE